MVAGQTSLARNDWRPFLYGGLAACVAETGTFPIDTTKIRLQMQGGRLDGRVVAQRYRGMCHALVRISAEEGVQALYRGISPALLRQSTYGTIKFGIYYSMKTYVCPPEGKESLPMNIFCAVTAGVVSSSLCNPADVLKVRLQSGPGASQGLWPAFRAIHRREGLRGLWRGVVPTAQRAGVVVGVELPVYDTLKQHLLDSGLKDAPSTHFLASLVASFMGAVASTPIDVIRTRLMNQRTLKAGLRQRSHAVNRHLYTGSLDCLLKTVQQEGLTALYKGFIPTWLRLGPWNIIFFITFEQLNRLY